MDVKPCGRVTNMLAVSAEETRLTNNEWNWSLHIVREGKWTHWNICTLPAEWKQNGTKCFTNGC